MSAVASVCGAPDGDEPGTAQSAAQYHLPAGQKYERGANRVSASRLWDISQILDVDISYFFEDMTRETRARSPRRISSGGDATAARDDITDPMARRETLELVRAYYSIEQQAFRRQITAMVKSFAAMISTANLTQINSPDQTRRQTHEQ